MYIAQITDTHIKAAGKLAYGKVDTAKALENSVSHINGLVQTPDLVLITGDLTDMGRPEEYAEFREYADRLTMPYFVIPGNHDERTAFRTAFSDHTYLPKEGEFLHYAIDRYDVRLLGLDTIIPVTPHGEMCTDRLSWLDKTLAAEPDKKTLLFMHHPPFATGLGYMDRLNCRNADALAAVIERHKQVIAITCGHLHRAVHTNWAGVTATVAPACSHSVALDLVPEGVPGFVLEPPACQLFYLTQEGNLIGHISPIGRFDGPYPFADATGKLID